MPPGIFSDDLASFSNSHGHSNSQGSGHTLNVSQPRGGPAAICLRLHQASFGFSPFLAIVCPTVV
ncbi:hypothetical protein JMJ78_0008173 [Colletotrichum scovillei]|nr:hypothetical protein JMJ78_0008173 [Colletotrichum scovillei]